MKTLLAASLAILSGCSMFPTAVDQCPLPVEQHPEAWKPITTQTGLVLGYVCVRN